MKLASAALGRMMTAAMVCGCAQAPSAVPRSLALEAEDRDASVVSPSQWVEAVLVVQEEDDPRPRVILDSYRGDDAVELGFDRFDSRIPDQFLDRAAAVAVQASPRTRLDEQVGRIMEEQPGEVLDVTLELDPPSATLHGLREPDADRGAIITARQAEIRERQAPVAGWVRAQGGEVIDEFWIANLLHVRVPRVALTRVRDVDGVRNVSGQGSSTPCQGYSGTQRRSATRADTAWALGFTGSSGGSRLRLAINESDLPPGGGTPYGNWPMVDSPAWQIAGGGTRIASLRDCRSSGCPTVSSPATQSPQHGSDVTAFAAASIMDGQDPAWTTTFERQRRSGMSRDAAIFYTLSNTCTDHVRAFQRAITDDVDIFNGSWSLGTQPPSYDCGGINACIAAALEANIVSVFAAGNGGPSSGTIRYPAFRPDALAVGVADVPSDPATPYDQLNVWSLSSRGPVSITYPFYSGAKSMAAVGVLTPGDGDFVMGGSLPRGLPSWYGPTGEATSWAAPIASGGAILFLDAMRDMGLTIFSRDVLTNLLLMGDGYDGDSTLMGVGVHPAYGMGRFRVLYPNIAVLGSGFGWGYAGAFRPVGTWTRTVGSSGPETGIRHWRWVTTLLEENLTAVQSDYIIQVVDACASGRPVIAQDASFDLRKRIQLFEADICPTPTTCRCLEMEIVVLQAPSGGARIHTADFFRANTGQL